MSARRAEAVGQKAANPRRGTRLLASDFATDERRGNYLGAPQIDAGCFLATATAGEFANLPRVARMLAVADFSSKLL
jgi:hypothetical protein